MTSPAYWSRRATGPSDELADYLIIWADYALEQYLALDPQVNTQLNERLRRLAQQPKNDARYNRETDLWSADFDAARGFIVYITSDDHQRLVILRVVHLG